MSTNTENYNLIKPAEGDFYDIGVQNGNMDIVDGALSTHENAIKNITGKPNVTDTPVINLEQAEKKINEKLDADGKSFQESLYQHQLNKILEVGSFGIGRTSNTLQTGEPLNNFRGNCFFSSNEASPENWDSSLGQYPMGIQITRSIQVASQLAFGRPNRLAFRYKVDSGVDDWTVWREIYHTHNSDVIVQKGSNANGEFIRFSDGTQICQKRKLKLDGNQAGRSARLANWSYPANFNDTPIVNVIMQGKSIHDITMETSLSIEEVQSLTYYARSASINTAQIRAEDLFREPFEAGDELTVSVLAIGRWR